jgi:cytochrome oxidase Cu insertion factor (SCO1/SenC/PrrC family)
MQPATQEAIERLGNNLHALTGDADQMAEIFRRFGVEPDSETAALYLIGPQVRLHALFTPDQDTVTIAEDLTTLITREP